MRNGSSQHFLISANILFFFTVKELRDIFYDNEYAVLLREDNFEKLYLNYFWLPFETLFLWEIFSINQEILSLEIISEEYLNHLLETHILLLINYSAVTHLVRIKYFVVHVVCDLTPSALLILMIYRSLLWTSFVRAIIPTQVLRIIDLEKFGEFLVNKGHTVCLLFGCD